MTKPIILCDCAGMSNERWLECRAHGPKGNIPYTVGGSDVATIFGLSPWMTPLELWMIKKGRMKTPAKANTDQLEMGHLLEPIAAYWYEKRSGNMVYDEPICINMLTTHMRWQTWIGAILENWMVNRGFWSVKVQPIIKPMIGPMV